MKILQILPTISYGDAVGNDTVALYHTLKKIYRKFYSYTKKCHYIKNCKHFVNTKNYKLSIFLVSYSNKTERLSHNSF